MPDWRDVVRIFDPQHSLAPHETDDLYAERPDAPHERVLESLNAATRDSPAKILFCGTRRGGKSTELARVHRLCQDDYFVVPLDVRDHTSPSHVSALEVLTLMGLSAASAACLDAATAKPPLKQLLTGFQKAIKSADSQKVLGEIDVVKWVKAIAATGALLVAGPEGLAAAKVAEPIVGPLAGGTKIGLPFTGSFRTGGVGAPEARTVLAAVDAILDHIAGASGKPVLLIVDSLDRITQRAPQSSFFEQNAIVAAPSAHIVCSGHISLIHSPLSADIRADLTKWVYCVDVPHVDQKARGVAWAETPLGQLVAKRLRRVGLSAADIVSGKALRSLIENSGGGVGDLVRFVREAASIAHAAKANRLSQATISEAIARVRKEYEFALVGDQPRKLLEVERTGRPDGDDDGFWLLYNNFVVCFVDGQPTFYPHPLLRGYLGRMRDAEASG